jgi:hypothetical protein
VKTDWFKDCVTDAGKRQQRKADIVAAIPALKALKRILEEKSNDVATSAYSKTNYEEPSWAYSQADNLGSIRAYQYVISLLDLGELNE